MPGLVRGQFWVPVSDRRHRQTTYVRFTPKLCHSLRFHSRVRVFIAQVGGRENAMYDRDQLASARAQFTGEALRGVRQRLDTLDRYASLLPAASWDQAELEAVLLDGLSRLTDVARPLGIREAVPGTDELELRLESAAAVRNLFALLPYRSKKGPWRGVRQLTVRPDGRYLRFELRTCRERYPNERPAHPHVRVHGLRGEDLRALLASHSAEVTRAGGTPHWDPAGAGPSLQRREPLERDVLRQLAPATGLASLILRRPRLWDSLTGYSYVQLSRERVDHGIDWIVVRPVDADPHDQRLLDAWTDDVVGGGMGIADHVCGPEQCVITLVPPQNWGRSGATLTITSRRVARAAGSPPHAARPLTVLGDSLGHSRPLCQTPASGQESRSGTVIGLMRPFNPSSTGSELPWTAEQIAAVWAAQGFATGLIVIGSQHPLLDWDLMKRRHSGEWPSQSAPRASARWSRLRLAPPPGGLWHLRIDSDDPQLSDIIGQARHDFDRVLVVEDSAWQMQIAQLGASIDIRVLTLNASPYPRNIPLPPAPHAPDQPSLMSLSPRESALQWRLDHLGNGDLSDHLPNGLLLLHHPAPRSERPTDTFANEVEEHLAMLGTPVLGHFPGRGLVVRGLGHSPHPATVLDPQVTHTSVLDTAPLHAHMEQAASALAQRLWPTAPVAPQWDDGGDPHSRHGALEVLSQ
jgi:hypothetical protein